MILSKYHNINMKILSMVLCFLPTLPVPTASQASHHIYSDSDLLAVDSDTRSYSVAVPPPQAFLDKLGISRALLPTPLPTQKQESPPAPSPVDHGNSIYSDGSYSFGYSTSNGVSRSESGLVTSHGYQVTGSYQYTGPDGVRYTVEFIADENGYRPRISKSTEVNASPRRGRTLLLKPNLAPTVKRRRRRKRKKNYFVSIK